MTGGADSQSADEMAELVDALEGHLGIDEWWALQASRPRNMAPQPGGHHWRWGVGPNWDTVVPNPVEHDEALMDAEGSAVSPVLLSVEEYPTGWDPADKLPHVALYAEEIKTATAGHIQRQDPARTLRRVAAVRATIAAWRDAVELGDPGRRGLEIALRNHAAEYVEGQL
ncbi:DUF6221 family protein [Micromonospora sp. RV43]|uniref:DUF6221 family protein n=1 Tax=Micromonospora sp. RV43 TaxID=1661387 RepID=UPI00064B84B8|nr:DUF6221 family protein [Micromonospora sp. RV43]